MRFKAIQRPIIISFLGFTSIVFEVAIDFLSLALFLGQALFNSLAKVADYLIRPITRRSIFKNAVADLYNGLRTVFTFPFWVLNIPQKALGQYLKNSYVGAESRPWYVKSIFIRLKRITDKIANKLSFTSSETGTNEDEMPLGMNFSQQVHDGVIRRSERRRQARLRTAQNHAPGIPPAQQDAANLEQPTLPGLLQAYSLPAIGEPELANQLDAALSEFIRTKELSQLHIYLMSLLGSQWWEIGSWTPNAKEQLRADIQNSSYVPERFYDYITDTQRQALLTNENLDSKCPISKNLVCIPVISGNRRFDLLQLLKTMLIQADQNYREAEYAGTQTVINDEFIVGIEFNTMAQEMIEQTINDMLNPNPPVSTTEHVTSAANEEHINDAAASSTTHMETPKPTPTITPLETMRRNATAGMRWLGEDGFVPGNTVPTAPPSEKEQQAAEQAKQAQQNQVEEMRRARLARFGGTPNPGSS